MRRVHAVLRANLPENQVALVLADERLPDKMRKNLLERGVRVLSVPGCGRLPAPVRSHPDMLCHHLGGKQIVVCRELPDRLRKKLLRLGFIPSVSTKSLQERYPFDCSLNAARAGNTLFARPKDLEPLLLSGAGNQKPGEQIQLRLIPVRQGYTKCSVCIVDAGSLMTADPGIAKAARKAGWSVLQISPGYVRLEGYPFGFIGGACGKISDKVLAFTGCIEDHPDYHKICAFLKSRGVAAVSLSDDPLTDYGGILPIAEICGTDADEYIWTLSMLTSLTSKFFRSESGRYSG